MSRVIAIANQKGGVAKSTTTVNLGAGLAMAGKTVLLIDLDPQGDTTSALGWNPDDLEVTVTNILEHLINDEKVSPEDGILHHDEGMDLLPADIELCAIENTLVNAMSREFILREYINIISDRYDYILIDTKPALGLLTINALACADEVMIPVQPARLPAKGLQQLIKTIGKVKRQLNPKIIFAGILITMINERTNDAKAVTKMIREAYGGKVRVFKNNIPLLVEIAEQTKEGISIFTYAPKGKGAAAYMGVTEEVLTDEIKCNEDGIL